MMNEKANKKHKADLARERRPREKKLGKTIVQMLIKNASKKKR
jgi:hypothetical protein